MSEKFALVKASNNSGTRSRRIELLSGMHSSIVAAIKVEYKLINDHLGYVNDSNDSDRIVLKTLYKDKNERIYYNGVGEYGNWKTVKENSGRTYLTEDQMNQLNDYVNRFNEFVEANGREYFNTKYNSFTF